MSQPDQAVLDRLLRGIDIPPCPAVLTALPAGGTLWLADGVTPVLDGAAEGLPVCLGVAATPLLARLAADSGAAIGSNRSGQLRIERGGRDEHGPRNRRQ